MAVGRCCYVGCRRSRSPGRYSCSEHSPLYDKVKQELAEARKSYVVRRDRVVPRPCAATGCEADALRRGRFCPDHELVDE